jgi:hypothetical protein
MRIVVKWAWVPAAADFYSAKSVIARVIAEGCIPQRGMAMGLRVMARKIRLRAGAD